MPLYFFDFTDGEHIGRDQFGTKLPDVETAAREAVAALANISKDVRKHYQDRALAVNIRSQTGETVLNVSLTLAVTSFPDEQIECDQLRVAEPIAPAMLPAQANSLTSLAARLRDRQGPRPDNAATAATTGASADESNASSVFGRTYSTSFRSWLE